MIRALLIFLCVILFVSCSKPGSLLEQSLASAQDNRNELEKVIEYYSKNERDSLKLKAAIFLIENMPFHFSYVGPKVDTINRVFQQLDMLNRSKTEITETVRVDLIKTAFGQIADFDLSDKLVSDNKLISSAYLIENIDIAFKAWETSPWHNEICFDDFCEYVLPYRIRNEQLEKWRKQMFVLYEKDSMSGKAYSDSVFDYYLPKYYKIRGSEFTRYYPYDMNFSQLDLTRGGECLDRCAYQIYFARAAGIPATFDNIPDWGNRPFAFHAMVGSALKNQQVKRLITNVNEPIDVSNTFVNASPRPMSHHLTKEELPNGLYVQYVKTIPKVYRQTWSAQSDILEVYNTVPDDQIYSNLMRLNMKDVSTEYMETADVEFILDNKYSDFKLIYLAVFDPKGWIPVAYARPEINGNVKFKDMGKEVVYMPVVYSENRLYGITDPFLLKSDGSVVELSANAGLGVDIDVIRKFPMFSYTASHGIWLRGMRFEGANQRNFSDSELIHDVNYYPFYMNSVKIDNPKKFRYLRCKPPQGGKLHLAEMAFYGVRGADTILLKGKLYSTYADSVMMQKGIDGDMLSYFRSYKRDESLCLDLGKDSATRIAQINFAPRNDANCIIPGNNYELFYWQNGWQSAGSKVASSYSITFDEVPANGLYWLRCKEGGKEERIFTYESNVQVWW